MAIKKRDLKVIREALDAGLTLELHERRGTRRFTAGQITDHIEAGRVWTTHRTPDMGGYVVLNAACIEGLAFQARQKLAKKDKILADQAASVASFLDR